jgi:hypothetical protein
MTEVDHVRTLAEDLRYYTDRETFGWYYFADEVTVEGGRAHVSLTDNEGRLYRVTVEEVK